MQKPQGKTFKKVGTPCIEDILDLLIEKYPNGIRGNSYTTRANRLTLEAITELLKVAPNKETFKQFLLADMSFKNLMMGKTNALIDNWYKQLSKAYIERTKQIVRAQKEKIAYAKHKKARLARQKLELQKSRAKLTNKETLWKELALSDKQKQILRKIAS